MRGLRGGVAAGGLAAVLCVAPAFAQAPASAGPGEELIDRTLAIVGGVVITQSDARLAERLRLLDGGPTASSDTTARLIERWLMLHEVERFVPGEPDGADVVRRLAEIATGAGGQTALIESLARDGRTLEDLEAWVRDDLRIAAYLEQRFASAGLAAESDVTAWLAANAAELEQRGLSGADAVRVARARLQQARRADLIADWVTDLRRRVEVQTFPR